MLWAFLCTVVITLAIKTIARWVRPTRPLPPGPPKYPIIGNLLNVPTQYQWLRYTEWAKEYKSDILHLQLPGNSIIVLNSLQATTDLLSRRSALYSSRPVSVMLSELMGWNFGFNTSPYGEHWRLHRRVFWQEFNPSNSYAHQPIQVKYARDLLKRLLDSPDRFLHHIQHTSGATIIEIVYGFPIQPHDDPHIARARKAMHWFDEAALHGYFLVDYFPILKYVPTWMPGAGFKVYAQRARHDTNQMIDTPYLEAKTLLAGGRAAPSFISRALAKLQQRSWNKADERMVKDVASMAYAGGADTTPSAVSTFVAALVSHPQVQMDAQAELDAVLGSRLPEFEDRQSLPYVTAVMLEVLRWQPIAPLTLRSLVSEDEYRGFHIPANSIVLANQWAILYDEMLFPEPEEFKPERFLRDGKIIPELSETVHVAFGFGRRICPGRYLAKDSLWISIASILSVYHITNATDENGCKVKLNIAYTPTLVRQPLPFKCSIKPRSERAEQMIRDCEL